jgi:hypothetical protein
MTEARDRTITTKTDKAGLDPFTRAEISEARDVNRQATSSGLVQDGQNWGADHAGPQGRNTCCHLAG